MGRREETAKTHAESLLDGVLNGRVLGCWLTVAVILMDTAFLLTVGGFLLAVELFYLELTILAYEPLQL